MERYFPDEPDEGISRAANRLMILVHDAGKSAARRLRNNRDYQYTYTEQLLDSLASRLPLDEVTLKRMKVLLRSDPLGPYLRMDSKQVDLDTTLAILEDSAREAGMTPKGYFKALTRYYQSDASAYTREVNGRYVQKDTFDKVFKLAGRKDSPGALAYDATERRITSPDVEKRWVALRDAVSRLDGNERSGAQAAVPFTEVSGAPRALAAPEGFPATLDELRVVKGLSGGAQLRQDAAGDLWVSRPDTASTGAVAEEVLADELYSVLGLGISSAVYRGSGGDSKLFRAIDDPRFREVSRDPSVLKAAQRAFASHALLGHKDVYTGANAVRVAPGRPDVSLSVVDSSGALRRTSKGAPRELSAVPLELWTERQSLPFDGLRWSQVVRQLKSLLDQKDALLRVASKDPELRRIIEGRLDNMAWLVDASGALKSAKVPPLQVERTLQNVMEAVKGGAARPSIKELVANVDREPVKLPEDAASILASTGLTPGVRYKVGDAAVTVRQQIGFVPSAPSYRVEQDVAGLESLPIMTLLGPDPLAQEKALAKYSVLRRDQALNELLPGAIPRLVGPAPGVLLHAELPGVPFGELAPALRERAMETLDELATYADSLFEQRGFGLKAGRSEAYARFNPESGEVSGWNGFLTEPPPQTPGI